MLKDPESEINSSDCFRPTHRSLVVNNPILCARLHALVRFLLWCGFQADVTLSLRIMFGLNYPRFR